MKDGEIVTTVKNSGVTEEQLVSKMVGRQLSLAFPSRAGKPGSNRLVRAARKRWTYRRTCFARLFLRPRYRCDRTSAFWDLTPDNGSNNLRLVACLQSMLVFADCQSHGLRGE